MTEVKYPELLDVHEAMAHLRAVVAEFGKDHVYTKPDHSGVCVYVHGSAEELVPGCIVAQVLHRHGVPMNVLSQYEGLGALQLAGPKSLTGRGVKPLLTEAAGTVLGNAQYVQDGLKPWGAALANAEDVYHLNGYAGSKEGQR